MPLIQEVHDLLPGFPVVALFREEPASGPFVSLRKPVRVGPMSDALRHALGRSPAAWNRHNIDVPALVQIGAEFTEVRVSSLSRHGVLVSPKHDFEAMRRFHEFFHARLDREFDGRIEFPGGEEPFHARAAYSEHTPDLKVRNVGLMARQIRLYQDMAGASYPELLAAVTTDGAMLWYLDGRDSTGDEPNENYARELMELFALGRSAAGGASFTIVLPRARG